MSAPTVDISNLDTTKLNPSDKTDELQRRAVLSSHNMISLAEKTLKKNQSLSKVIIMEHPPRFDTPFMDPTCIKPKLARLANATLGGLWLNSPLVRNQPIKLHSKLSNKAYFSRRH